MPGARRQMSGSFVMRLLVFGGTGMLGHQLWETCRTRLDAYFTGEVGRPEWRRGEPFSSRTEPFPEVRAEDPASIGRALDETRRAGRRQLHRRRQAGCRRRQPGRDHPGECALPAPARGRLRERGVRLIQVFDRLRVLRSRGALRGGARSRPGGRVRPFEAAGRGGSPAAP